MPRLLDLFCGRWGWSREFARRGWECVGIDLTTPPETPEGCTFVQADILKLRYNPRVGFYIMEGAPVGFFDFVCASSSCEQFSVHGMKHFHPNPPFPEMGLKLFNHTHTLCEASGVPYVMENVRAAQQFVGPAVHHCGPFYLWGTGVPPLVAQGIGKGTKFGLDRESRKKHDMYYRTGSKSKARREWKAKVAEIPDLLSAAVCDYAGRLIPPHCPTDLPLEALLDME